ncbi:MAG: IS66 family transposase [Cetobacterium sp.]
MDLFNHFTHALCWAHFLKELQSIQDNTSLKFPENIKNSIFKLKNIVDKDEYINEAEELSLYLEYVAAVEEEIIEEKQYYPFDPISEGKPKRSKIYNLFKRLSRYEDVLKFFTERNAEIFTNNSAEREIRNVKG